MIITENLTRGKIPSHFFVMQLLLWMLHAEMIMMWVEIWQMYDAVGAEAWDHLARNTSATEKQY